MRDNLLTAATLQKACDRARSVRPCVVPIRMGEKDYYMLSGPDLTALQVDILKRVGIDAWTLAEIEKKTGKKLRKLPGTNYLVEATDG